MKDHVIIDQVFLEKLAKKDVRIGKFICIAVLCGLELFVLLPAFILGADKENPMKLFFMIGIPVISIFGYVAIYMIVMRFIERTLNKVKAGEYRLYEDIVVGKYIDRTEVGDGKYTNFYSVIGAKRGNRTSNIQEHDDWDELAVGDRIFIYVIGDTTVRCFSGNTHSVSPELKDKTTFVIDSDIDHAKKVFERLMEEGKLDFTLSLEKVSPDFLPIANHYVAQTGKRMVVCGSCGKRFDAVKYKNTCPKCGALFV